MATTLEEIKQLIVKLRQDIEDRLSRMVVSAKQVRTTSLSEISEVLGLIQSYEFRTPGEPGTPTYSGIQILPEGINTYNEGSQTGAIESDGDVSFGSNIDSPDTTGFKIFSQAQTYNGESMGAGDVLFGDNSTDEANMLWDASAKEMRFRLGQVDTNKIGGGHSLYDYGCRIRRSTDLTIDTAPAAWIIPFDTVDYDDAGFTDLGTEPTRITIPVGYAGRYEIGFYAVSNSISTYTEGLVVVNDSSYTAVGSANPTNATSNVARTNGSVNIELEEGDYIRLFIFYGDVGTLTATPHSPALYIRKLR